MDNTELGRPGGLSSQATEPKVSALRASIPDATRGFDWWRLLPIYWSQNYPTDRVWDAILCQAIDLFGVTVEDQFTCKVGPFTVWIENWPYAYGYSWRLQGSRVLPMVRTRRKLRALTPVAPREVWNRAAEAAARATLEAGEVPWDSKAPLAALSPALPTDTDGLVERLRRAVFDYRRDMDWNEDEAADDAGAIIEDVIMPVIATLITQQSAEISRLTAELGEARQKLRMIVSHATGGASSDIDASVNDISVAITAKVNLVWEHAQEVAREKALREAADVARAHQTNGKRMYGVVGKYDEAAEEIAAAILALGGQSA